MSLVFELVVPAYNESKNLEMLINRAITAAKNHNYTEAQFKFVIVQNGSLDDSKETLTKLCTKPEVKDWIRVVQIEKNQGYGYGLATGLKTCTAPFVAWSHADMQCDPNDSFKALKILMAKSEKTLVKGTRFGRNWKDRLVSKVFEFFSLFILGNQISEINAQPKVFNGELLSHIKNPPHTFAFDLYVLYQAQKAGYQFQTIDVEFPPRIHGVSNWANNFFGRYKTILGMIRYMWELSQKEGRL